MTADTGDLTFEPINFGLPCGQKVVFLLALSVFWLLALLLTFSADLAILRWLGIVALVAYTALFAASRHWRAAHHSRMIYRSFVGMTWLFGVVLAHHLAAPTDAHIYILLIVLAGILIGGVASIMFGALSLAALVMSHLWLYGQLLYPLQVAGAIMLVTALTAVTVISYRRTLSQVQRYNAQLQAEIIRRRQAEEEQRVTTLRYQILMESVPLPVLVYDLHDDLQLMYANPATLRLFGVESQADLPQRARDFEYATAEDAAQFRQRFKDYVLADKPTLPKAEYKIMINGRVVPLAIRSRLFEQDGHKAVLSILSDQTERIAADQLRRQLEREQQISAVREGFVGLMSHEFRTPLAVIRSSADILHKYRDQLTPERSTYHIEKIFGQVKTMTRMVEDILALSRANADMLDFRPAQGDLVHLMNAFMEEFYTAHDTDHVIDFESVGELAYVWIDRELLHHIVMNLLSNAAKYAPPDEVIRVRLVREGDYARLTVTDYGIGIPEGEEDIFKPFVRGSNVDNRPGTGAGLALAKFSAERHGGDISYVSEPGETTFTAQIKVVADDGG